MKELVVKVDTNDADYNTTINRISGEDLEILSPLFEAISLCKERHNYPYHECCDDKSPEKLYPHIPASTLELFQDEYTSYGEHGFHTIASIKVREVINEFTFVGY